MLIKFSASIFTNDLDSVNVDITSKRDKLNVLSIAVIKLQLFLDKKQAVMKKILSVN